MSEKEESTGALAARLVASMDPRVSVFRTPVEDWFSGPKCSICGTPLPDPYERVVAGRKNLCMDCVPGWLNRLP